MRIVLGAAGVVLLALDPAAQPHPIVAGLGCIVIAATGVVECFTAAAGALAVEEILACLAVVTIIGVGQVPVSATAVLWLVSAAVGVLARGGRVGRVAPLVVLASFLIPLAARGAVSAPQAGLSLATLALLLAAGRISRDTCELLCDPLTGALTRAALRAEAARLAARSSLSRPLTVVMVDFDDFGTVNKLRGYAAGDALLGAASRAMRLELGCEDVIGRMGGDEFAVLTSGDRPMDLARRLVRAASGAGAQASAGLAQAPADAGNVDELLVAADFALRIAKRGGKCRVERYRHGPFAGADRDSVRASFERLCTGEGIAMGLQPIVSLHDGGEHAYEALAQFDCGSRAEPLFFLTLADALGLRPSLERACLRKSVALAGAMPKGVRLGVNVGAGMLVDDEALEILLRCSAPNALILEVASEKLTCGQANVERAVQRLRGRGIQIAIDELRPGVSDLAQLAVLRPEYIKLDRTLIAGVDSDRSRACFVGACAQLARSLGSRAVAVGIESHGELDAARRAGLELGQGDLLAHVMSSEHARSAVEPAGGAVRALRAVQPAQRAG